MTAEEIRLWLEDELANFPQRASGEEVYDYLVRRTAPLVESDRNALVGAMSSWLQMRSETGPQTMLALEIVGKHRLKELRHELDGLLRDIRQGKAFLPYYERWVIAALNQLERADE